MSDVISDVLVASTYYEVLGVEKDVTYAEIKTAYRRRVLTCHPDKCPNDKNASNAFSKIHKAFGVLGDKKRRDEYNVLGQKNETMKISEEEEELQIRQFIIQLSFAVNVPDDGLLDDFVTFVRKLSQEDDCAEILMSSVVRGCFVGIATAFSLPVTPLGFSLILALGPAAFGPAVAWETVLAKFEGVSVRGRIVKRPLQTMQSLTRTTVNLTFMWSVFCISLSVYLVASGTAYTFNLATVLLAKNGSREDMEEWFIITLDKDDDDNDDVLFTSSYDTKHLELQVKDENGTEWIVINNTLD